MSDQTQAERDADAAHMYGVACLLAEERPGARERRRHEQVIDDYTMDLLDQIGADPAQLYAAARVACIRAAEDVEHPALFRQDMRAVDLCRRAAQLAGELEPAQGGDR